MLNSTHSYSVVGTYTITLLVTYDNGCSQFFTHQVTVIDCTCDDCIGSFSPIPDKNYVISAWVKEEGAALSKTTYDKPIIQLHCAI